MRAAFDLEARKLLNWNLAALAVQTVRRRDLLPIELKAVKGAEGLALPSDVTIYATVKSVAAGPQGPALAVANTFTVSGTGSNAVYSLLLNLNTSGVNGLFSAETAQAACVLEIELVSAQFRLTAEALQLTVQNDYARESDEDPTALPDNKATQAEAEAGENNGKWMTPLRVAQAIAALAEGGGGGGGTSNFTLKTAGFSAQAGGCYLVDTTSAALTATLPTNPALGQRILFADARGTWDTHPLTIARNGKLIDGFAVNFIAATSGMYFEMVFVDNTTGWRILAAGSKPINLTAPVMTASVLSGTWSCGTGEWTASPTNFLRQWEASDDDETFTPIDGATGATFSPDASYDGKYLRCSVTAVNSNGNSTPSASNSAAAYAVSSITAPSIVGGNTVGQELSLEGDTWTAEGVLDYQWEKDHGGGAESLANTATYTPTSADIGAVIVCKVRLWPSGEPGEGVSSEQVTTDPTEVIEAAPFPTSNMLEFWGMNSETGDGQVQGHQGNNLNVPSGITFAAGKIGNAAVMPGGNVSFDPFSSVTLPSTGWTIALWFKIAVNESQNHMFAADAGYSNLYFMEHGGGVHVSWGIATPYGGSNAYLALNTWYHVALTYDGAAASGTGKLFINGVQYGSTITGLNLATFNIVPGAMENGDQAFKGTLDAYGVWERALTLEEVGQLYNGGDGAEP
jgi:hypothetical protein